MTDGRFLRFGSAGSAGFGPEELLSCYCWELGAVQEFNHKVENIFGKVH